MLVRDSCKLPVHRSILLNCGYLGALGGIHNRHDMCRGPCDVLPAGNQRQITWHSIRPARDRLTRDPPFLPNLQPFHHFHRIHPTPPTESSSRPSPSATTGRTGQVSALCQGVPSPRAFREETKLENVFAPKAVGARLARGSQTSTPDAQWVAGPQTALETHESLPFSLSTARSGPRFSPRWEFIRSTYRHAAAYSCSRRARGVSPMRYNPEAKWSRCQVLVFPAHPWARAGSTAVGPPTTALYIRRQLWCRRPQVQSFGRREPVSCGEAVKGLLPWRPSRPLTVRLWADVTSSGTRSRVRIFVLRQGTCRFSFSSLQVSSSFKQFFTFSFFRLEAARHLNHQPNSYFLNNLFVSRSARSSRRLCRFYSLWVEPRPCLLSDFTIPTDRAIFHTEI